MPPRGPRPGFFPDGQWQGGQADFFRQLQVGAGQAAHSAPMHGLNDGVAKQANVKLGGVAVEAEPG